MNFIKTRIKLFTLNESSLWKNWKSFFDVFTHQAKNDLKKGLQNQKVQ
jgi:hypothetical protein